MTLEEISRNWTPPAGLGYSGLRPVRLARHSWVLVTIAAILGIGSFVLADFMWRRSNEQTANRARLESEGAGAGATVVRVWRSSSKEHTPQVTYRFEVNGEAFRSTCDAPERIWRTLHEDDPIEIRYVPGNPKINHPAAWRMDILPLWLAALMPLMGFILPLTVGTQIRRQWRLLAEGRPAPGIITKVRRRDKNHTVYYDFLALSGAVQKGRSCAPRNVPGVGSVVCILYDPENPRRSGVYPLQMVRLME